MNSLKKIKVFYNFVIDVDLFYTIYDYLRFNSWARNKYNIHSLIELENLSVDKIKEIAYAAIDWLTEYQLPKIHKLDFDDVSPNSSTWGTLYYQALNYIAVFDIHHSIRKGDLNVTIELCKQTIEYLKDLVEEIREVTDEDLDNI